MTITTSGDDDGEDLQGALNFAMAHLLGDSYGMLVDGTIILLETGDPIGDLELRAAIEDTTHFDGGKR